MTFAQLRKQLRKTPTDKLRPVTCALIGHSRIHTNCMGYKYCARCGTQVGDSLGGYYDGKNNVLVGHNCETCRANYKKMNWKDKYLTPDPFKEEVA